MRKRLSEAKQKKHRHSAVILGQTAKRSRRKKIPAYFQPGLFLCFFSPFAGMRDGVFSMFAGRMEVCFLSFTG